MTGWIDLVWQIQIDLYLKKNALIDLLSVPSGFRLGKVTLAGRGLANEAIKWQGQGL